MVADAVSEAIGLQLTVSGRFDLEVGSISRVVAEDVTLANPAWSTAPALVHADRVEVDLSSVVPGVGALPHSR